MNTPPMLVGAALLYWGWQAGLLVIAVPFALALEGSRYVTWRLDLDQDHFNRLWNLSVLLFVGSTLYVFFAQGGYSAMNTLIQAEQISARTDSLKEVSNFALTLVRWFPLNLLLFMLAFAFSRNERLPMATFSLYLRARRGRAESLAAELRELSINPSYAFFIFVMVATGASSAHPNWFFPAMAGFIAWALWYQRSRRFRPWAWAGLIVLTLGIAFAGQIGVVAFQQKLEAWQNAWMQRFGKASEFDARISNTSIGSRGAMKMSGRIVLRVQPMDGPPPALLREAAFDVLTDYDWSASRGRFDVVRDADDDYTWVLEPATANRAVGVLGYTRHGERTLPLPNGVAVLTDRTYSVTFLKTNLLGSAQILGAGSLASFELRYSNLGGTEPSHELTDLAPGNLAASELAALDQVARDLHLAELPPADAVKAIREFFLRDFAYALDPEKIDPERDRRPTLAEFLLTDKAGHCEYFATTTTLLLRMAGIPARYAVGYAVQEKRNANEFIVRDRHAHAWSLAWLDGRWQEIDNTPGEWFASDAANARAWERINDAFSHAWLAFNLWRAGDSQMRLYVFIAGVLILGFMAWRQVAGKHWRYRSDRRGGRSSTGQGLDSELYQIERVLLRDQPRAPHESLAEWLERQLQPATPGADLLRQLLELHYRLRFDPAGLDAAAREQLRRGVAEWLQVFRSAR